MDEESDNDSFNDWEDDDEEVYSVKSLFSPLNVFNSINDLIEHDSQHYNFNLRQIVTEHIGFNDIHLIMLINFVRRRVKENLSVNENIDSLFVDSLMLEITGPKRFLQDKAYMQPVDPEDPLLFMLKGHLKSFDSDDEDDDIDGDVAMGNQVSPNSDGVGLINDLQGKVAMYKDLVAVLTNPEESKDTVEVIDNEYFDSYAHFSIHETMLRDAARTNAYAQAIALNSNAIKGKVVLDVGCGTGILSMLAARAGAKRVIGIDCSGVLSKAQKIIDRNGLTDVITLVRGQIEHTPLPIDYHSVDIIISEWMGYGLYYENMLSSVLYAKDHYLTEDGILMPSSARLFVEFLGKNSMDHEPAGSDRVAWWKDVYGFDMTDMMDCLTSEAQAEDACNHDVISDKVMVHDLNIGQANDSDLDFEVDFELTISKETTTMALCITFDVLFEGPEFKNPVTLSTGLDAPFTHWKHTTLWLSPENVDKVFPGDVITGRLSYRRLETNNRQYGISVEWSPRGSPRKRQEFIIR